MYLIFIKDLLESEREQSFIKQHCQQHMRQFRVREPGELTLASGAWEEDMVETVTWVVGRHFIKYERRFMISNKHLCIYNLMSIFRDVRQKLVTGSNVKIAWCWSEAESLDLEIAKLAKLLAVGRTDWSSSAVHTMRNSKIGENYFSPIYVQ